MADSLCCAPLLAARHSRDRHKVPKYSGRFRLARLDWPGLFAGES
jgi:hypothetical protein